MLSPWGKHIFLPGGTPDILMPSPLHWVLCILSFPLDVNSPSAKSVSACSFLPLTFSQVKIQPILQCSASPSLLTPLSSTHTEPACLSPAAHPLCFLEKRDSVEGRTSLRVTCPPNYAMVESPWENHSISQSLSFHLQNGDTNPS